MPKGFSFAPDTELAQAQERLRGAKAAGDKAAEAGGGGFVAVFGCCQS